MNPPQVYISLHSWTPLLPPSPYHPSGLSQCTSPKHPVSCIEPRLVIRSLHDNIHVSIPFSQIIPPSPSPSAKETQMCRVDFWTLRERERERMGWFGRMALKHVYYHVRNASPVYVWCRIQDAWGWCTGIIQRDVMGREVGGGFMFGNAGTPMVDSCQCTAKSIEYCKVK